MIEPLELVGFLALGLLGGFGHCLGMCAPFVLWVSDRFGEPGAPRQRNLGPHVLFALGRLTTYTALGALAGFLGSIVAMAGTLVGVGRAASIVAGGLLVLYGLVGVVDVLPFYPRGGGRLFGRVAALLQRRQPRRPYGAGLFLGLLPCGLLYGALIAAAATGTALRGALSLAFFGAGTLPAMLGLALVSDLLRRRRGLLDTLSHVFVLAMGVWFLWQGVAG